LGAHLIADRSNAYAGSEFAQPTTRTSENGPVHEIYERPEAVQGLILMKLV
jgi:hypothetical protein